MTCIAYRNGILAADSQSTDDNNLRLKCKKLYRIGKGKNKGHIVATAGADFPGEVFVRWYEQGGDHLMPTADRDLISEDDLFLCLVLTPEGLFVVDKSCLLVPIIIPFYAIGCGGAVAMGAMEKGAGAREAVAIACKWDSNCELPVVSMRLEKTIKPSRKKRK